MRYTGVAFDMLDTKHDTFDLTGALRGLCV